MKIFSFSLLIALCLGTELTIVSPEVKALPSENSYQISQSNPTSAIDFLNRGVAKGRRGDLKGAIEDFNQALSLNPNYAQAYYNRGVAYAHLGENQKAIADYSQALSLNPNYADAYNNRGNAYSELGEYQRARVCL